MQQTKAQRKPAHKERMAAKRKFIATHPNYSMRVLVTYKFFQPIIDSFGRVTGHQLMRIARNKQPLVHEIPVEAISGRSKYIPAGKHKNV